jgi:hypothetical protein
MNKENEIELYDCNECSFKHNCEMDPDNVCLHNCDYCKYATQCFNLKSTFTLLDINECALRESYIFEADKDFFINTFERHN